MRYFFLLLALLAGNLYGQRLTFSDANAPFYHGVASGDPRPDRVILWTRVTPEDTSSTLNVNWRVATDTTFSTLVASGTTSTNAARDFTVKVDAAGLQPNTWYYYDFQASGGRSLIGRTRTAPTGGVSELRFAVVTCSDYKDGWFNAYARIAARNDIDAVLHLGDYIYESDSDEDNVRQVEPDFRVRDLAGFRQRYAYYRLDPELVAVHQQYPFITVWDDHEFSNDAWQYGAEKEPDSATFVALAADAAQAYYEWLPIRSPDSSDADRIYRHFPFGSLLDLFMLDTRKEGRQEQLGIGDPGVTDTNRTILGKPQRDWLLDNLAASTATWRILGQQVIFMPLGFNLGPTFIPVNNDQWDGYQADRNRILDLVNDNNIANLAVLTGDAHLAFAGDLYTDLATYDPDSGTSSVGVEFVTPSISSNAGDFPVPVEFAQDLIETANPHVKHIELLNNGYLVLTVRPDRLQGDFWIIPEVFAWSDAQQHDRSYFALNGLEYLQTAPEPWAATGSYPPLAPWADGYAPDQLTARTAAPGALVLHPYPNPADYVTNLPLVVQRAGDYRLEVLDLTGRVVRSRTETLLTGPQEIVVGVDGLPAGVYTLRVAFDGQRVAARRLVVE